MDQAQWAQTEIALLPTEQIALRPSVQQKPLSHMPLETLAASMAREGLREPILVRAAAQGYIIVETFSVAYYVPVLLIAGVITGFIIGVVANEMLKRLGSIVLS